jgi:hypothetical protein
MNNKQEERKIMNYLRKIISNTYKYIRQACGFEDDVDVAPGSKLSREDAKIDSTDSTASNENMAEEKAIKEKRSARPKKPAAKRKIAATRKKPIKKTTRKSTKKPIKKAVKKT